MDSDTPLLREPPESPYDPRSFDSPVVRAVAPPIVVALAILIKISPFGFLLEGFHVWIHEVGHSSVAWLCSQPAVPLPFGWSNVAPNRSLILYLGILGALGYLGVSGWRERRAWPMILAAALIGTQAFMTWRLGTDVGREAMIFSGVGGEFYLSAAMVGLFFFEFPESFKWGSCRYVALLVGAASFFESYSFWKDVKRGAEGIPYGSMINGEGDGGGDMNILLNDYHWTQHRIVFAYNHLADGCLVAVLAIYLFFNLNLNRVFHPLLARVFSIGLGDRGQNRLP